MKIPNIRHLDSASKCAILKPKCDIFNEQSIWVYFGVNNFQSVRFQIFEENGIFSFLFLSLRLNYFNF